MPEQVYRTKTEPYICALTIAGSDPSGGAGIQADLKTFSALGVYGSSVITAITVQNSVGVFAIHVISPDIIAAQLDAVLDDIPVRTVKIGMLPSADSIIAVADRLKAHRISNIILDPVMVATNGTRLMPDSSVGVMVQQLFPLTELITPNLPEAARLLGYAGIDDPMTAILELRQLCTGAVLLKGGHASEDELVDILAMPGSNNISRFCHRRIATPHTHGTGCALSSAIAAGIAKGKPIPKACEGAIDWLQGALVHSRPLGAGRGPVNYFWQWERGRMKK